MTSIDYVLARLTAEEGTRLLPYDDATGKSVVAPAGNLSWGRGFNLMACGSTGLFEVMERYLLEQAEAQLVSLPWYTALDAVRASVVLDIAYNAGVGGLLRFVHMIAALADQDWERASKECAVVDARLDAQRYAVLRKILLTGEP